MENGRSCRLKRLCCAVALVGLAGCTPKPEPGPETPDKGTLVVTSPAFANGKPIPAKYTGDGDDVSPPLKWTGLPAGTRSVALICDDPDAPGGDWTHWVLFNITPSETSLPEGVPEAEELPRGAMHGLNDFGRPGYGGPAPPSGPAHRYRFRVYALDTVLIVRPRAKRSALDDAMAGHILATGELVGTYGR